MLSDRPESRHRRWSCGALALFLVLGACSRFEPIQDPVAQTHELIGYEVRVTTTEGRVLRFVLRDVTQSELVGDLRRVRLDKVAKLERWHFSIVRTALLLVVFAGLYALPALWL